MASSNRHWPSMFKSKPTACTPHHPWQHDITPAVVSGGGCHRSPYSSVAGCEERSPEPKPRWNPKPEQIRILEAIFNSGMVNPPRDEIRRIRAQLQEYGQVGDANVFYWFQNRKSRSKHKLRKQQQQQQQTQRFAMSTQLTPNTLNILTTAPSSSSSSSSEKSSPNTRNKAFVSAHDVSLNSPTGSVNQSHANFLPHEALPEPPLFFPVHHHHQPINPNVGFYFSELGNVVTHHHEQTNFVNGPCTSLLLSEIMNHGGGGGGAISRKDFHQDQDQEDQIIKGMKLHLMNYNLNDVVTTTSASPTASSTTTSPPLANSQPTIAVPSPMIHNIQGSGGGNIMSTAAAASVAEAGAVGLVVPGGAAKSTVFINDVAFEVGAGPFNVREAFGDDAVLIHSSGQPVLTNEWGLTLHSLHHGAFYYLI